MKLTCLKEFTSSELFLFLAEASVLQPLCSMRMLTPDVYDRTLSSGKKIFFCEKLPTKTITIAFSFCLHLVKVLARVVCE